MACKSKKSDPCTCKSKKSDSNLKNLIFWYFFKSLYFYCCNLSGGVALIVWFTTNGMCAKNKNIYAWCKQAIIREIATHALYCCLLPWCEALRTCRSGFPIATLSTLSCLHMLNNMVTYLPVFSPPKRPDHHILSISIHHQSINPVLGSLSTNHDKQQVCTNRFPIRMHIKEILLHNAYLNNFQPLPANLIILK